jgi:Protein of unknown function (DUF4236)
MGWSFRKSFRLLPGVRINLSKSGPRLSVGVPGARASIDMKGKTRLYGGAGPLRYQKTATLGATVKPKSKGSGLLEFIKGIFSG